MNSVNLLSGFARLVENKKELVFRYLFEKVGHVPRTYLRGIFKPLIIIGDLAAMQIASYQQVEELLQRRIMQ